MPAAVKLSATFVRSLWFDPSMRSDTISRLAGCSYATVAHRAKAIGLPRRDKIIARGKLPRCELFAAMWRAGVSSTKIAAHFGVGQPAVSRAAADMGLPPRKEGQAGKIRMSTFKEIIMAADMSAKAAAERASIKSGKPVAHVGVDLKRLFPLNTGPSLTDQRWEDLHAKGCTVYEAAAARGVTMKAAWMWAKRNGTQWAPGRVLPIGQADAVWRALHDLGFTATEAAAKRGLTRDAAYVWARSQGVKWKCGRGGDANAAT